MFKATKAIFGALKRSDMNLKVFTEENEKSSRVWLQFGAKNGSSYRIQFISTDDDNDVAVRVFGLISVEDGKGSRVLPVLNQLNSKFRYVKFVMDDDGDINVEYDFPVRATRVEDSAEEIVIRFVRIIDDAFPDLMHALWS